MLFISVFVVCLFVCLLCVYGMYIREFMICLCVCSVTCSEGLARPAYREWLRFRRVARGLVLGRILCYLYRPLLQQPHVQVR